MYQQKSASPLQFKTAGIRSRIAFITLIAFIVSTLVGPINAFAQENLILPPVGQMVNLSPQFTPMMIKGIKIHKDNPFEFDFIVNPGQENFPEDQFQKESLRLVKYFLASLAIPENDLWVNLSPYEKNRITTPELGVTEMGKDLLSQDYVLKQLTSSLIYPEGETGKRFWSKVYTLAEEKFHTTNISINTFNKVWIVPQKAVVYENYNNQTAYVLESKLKVMLEEDYLALNNHVAISKRTTNPNDINSLGSQIVREIVIPELTMEVNSGQNFANLRQITNSLILAAWFKRALKASILAKLYVDQKKIRGVDLHDRTVAQRIFQQYLRAYKKGVYNYIKEEADPVSGHSIPRKYFSGGYKFIPGSIKIENALDPAQLIREVNDRAVIVQLDNAIGAIRPIVPVIPQRAVILSVDQKQLLDALFAIFWNRRGKDFLLNPQRRNNPQFNAADIQREVNKTYKHNGPSRLSASQLNAFNSLVKRPGAFNTRVTKEQYAAYIQEREDRAMAADSLIELAKAQLEKFGEVIDTADKQHRFAQRYQDQIQGWIDLNLKDILKNVVPHLEHPKEFQRYERNLILPPIKTPLGQIALFIHVANPLKGVPPHFHGDNEIGGFAWIVPLNTTFIEEKWLGLPSHRGQKVITLNQADVIIRKPGIVYHLADDDGPHVMLNTSPTEYGAFLELYILPPNGIKGFDIPVPQSTPDSRVNSIIPQVDANRLLRFNDFGVAATQGGWQEVSSNDEDAIDYILHNPNAVVFQVVHGVNVVIPQDRLSRDFLRNAALILRDPKQPRLFIVFDAAMVVPELASESELKDYRHTLITADGVTRVGNFTFTQDDLPSDPVDVVIVGAGASGLATALQSTDHNLKTVVLEAGYVAQSFSDAYMNFWRMRTPAFRFWLAQKGFNSLKTLSELDFTKKLPGFRSLALQAAERIKQYIGKDFSIAQPDGFDDPTNFTVPLARAEAFQHFLSVANAVVERGGLIRENDPVFSSIKRPDGLFEITTQKGIKVITKNVVYATGLGNERIAEIVQELSREQADQYALVSTPQEIPENGFKNIGKLPILASQVLNDPRVVEFVGSLAKGSSIGIVGGGQSLGNSVTFIHSIRPDIIVHVFTKNKLTVHGSQMPGGFRKQHLMWEYVNDEDLRTDSWSKGGPETVDTPITPPNFKHINDTASLEKPTTVVHVLGKYFDEDNFEILTQGATARVLDKQSGQEIAVIRNGGFISAVGFTLKSPQRNALYANAQENGLIQIYDVNGIIKMAPNGLTSLVDDHVYIAGIQLLKEGSVPDGSTHGTVVRARAIVENIIHGKTPRLSDEERLAKVQKDYAKFFDFLGDTPEKETVAAFLTLAKSQAGETQESIKEKYQRALTVNPPLQAARYVADVAGQTGRDVVEGKEYSIPELTEVKIIDRIFATDMPGYLGQQDGKRKIGTLFREISWTKTGGNLSATEQLLYPATEYGVGHKKAFGLYDRLYSNLHNPEIAAVLARAAATYLPFSDGDRAQSTELPLNIHQEQLDPGGIDLNTANLDFQIRHNGQGIPLSVQYQNLANIHINGLRPIIIKDVPITNLYEYLGANTSLTSPAQLASF